MSAAATAGPAKAGAGTLLQAFLLAGVAGFADGFGISYVSGVFVSFMSGNTTSTGAAIGTAQLAAFAHVAPTIPLFVIGVITGAVIARRGPSSRRPAFASVAALLVGFLVWKLVSPATDPGATGPAELVDLALLVVPMGILATTLRSVGPRSVGIGYVTGSLVSFGEAVATFFGRGARDGASVVLYGGVWMSFLTGAALGAFGAHLVGPWAVLLPVAVLAAVAAMPVPRGAAPG